MEVGSMADWFSGIATVLSTGVAVWLAVHQYIKESKAREERAAIATEQRRKKQETIREIQTLILRANERLHGSIGEAQKPNGQFSPTFFEDLRPLITSIQVEAEKLIPMQHYRIDDLFDDAIQSFRSKPGHRRGLVSRDTLVQLSDLESTLSIVYKSVQREYDALT